MGMVAPEKLKPTSPAPNAPPPESSSETTHDELVATGLATTRPLGNTSVSATLVTGNPLILVIVTDSVARPPWAICEGVNVFNTVGGGVTVSVATFDAAPRTASAACKTPVVWFELIPVTLLVTCTVMVQLALAGMVPAVTVNVVPPATAFETTPAQVPPTVALDNVICRTSGGVRLVSTSVKLIPVTGTGKPLASVNVNVDVPPMLIVGGENALAIPTLPTDRVAVLLVPSTGTGSTPLVVVLDEMTPTVLLILPATVGVTLIVTTQGTPTA